jgi:hypothetical protein
MNINSIALEKVLHNVLNSAVDEAVRLQLDANSAHKRYKGGSFAEINALESGVRALSHVLSEAFNALSIDVIRAVKTLAEEHEYDRCDAGLLREVLRSIAREREAAEDGV